MLLSRLVVLLAHYTPGSFLVLLFSTFNILLVVSLTNASVFFDHETRDFAFIVSLTFVTLEFRRLSCAIAIYLYSSNGIIGAKQTNYCVKIVFFILHL